MGFKHSYRDGWVWDDSQTTAIPNYAECTSYTIPYTIPSPQYGWICPRCGQVNAPWMAFCSCKKENLIVKVNSSSDESTAGPHPSASTSYTSET